MESPSKNNAPGATATGNKLVVGDDKVVSTIDCGDSDPVSHDLPIPNIVDTVSAMSTIHSAMSTIEISISDDALVALARTTKAEFWIEHLMAALLENGQEIPSAVQDTAAASSSANRDLGSAPHS